MAQTHNSPWTMTCDPSEVAACTTSIRFSVTRGAWADPALADLVAPPVTVTAFTIREAVPRRPGRDRAPRRTAHVAGSRPGSRAGVTYRFYRLSS